MKRDDGIELFPWGWRRLLAVSIAWLVSTGASWAQEAELTEEQQEERYNALVESFGWERSGAGKLGSQAEIVIPEGYRFTGRSGTNGLMELYGNPASSSRMGVLAPENLDWFVVFSFEDSGYVKDDEKDDLDAKALMKHFIADQERSNVSREAAGMGKLFVTGWAKEPFYNESTNNLEWALRLEDQAGVESLNYKTKILGRHGVVDSVLVCGPEELESLLPTYQELIAGFGYSEGNSYAEYKKGDKIAEYGLMGLVAGGVGFAAAKAGLFGILLGFLKKGWVLVVAAVVGIKTWLGRLFSGKKNQYTVDS